VGSSYPVIDARPAPPVTTDLGIAIVGCGGIVNYAHLPAYRQHDLRIVGCFDKNLAAAKETAGTHGIARVYDSLDQVVADDNVQIVDIAIHPTYQPGVAVRCLEAGKHVLCQKPLGLSVADARLIADAAGRTGRKAAVNQQMRWTAGITAARQLIEMGYVGQLTDLQFNVSVKTPWEMWPWLRDSEQLDVMFHSIHYHDAIRFLAGDPFAVTSRHSRFAGQPERAETKTITVLDYETGCQALIAVNHHDESGGVRATYRVLGADGVIEGDIGLLATYPDGGPDTIRARRRNDPAGEWQSAELTSLWIPDAFIGPMASLIQAIVEDGQPATAVADNLTTIKVVAAAYQSMREERTIRLDEVIG
jgi:predicted dehydrogenase